MTSNETKKYKSQTIIFSLLSVMLTVLPIVIYTFIGLLNNSIHSGDKLFLGFSLIMSIILVLINTLMKYHLRSPLFIMLLGLYVALENILPLLVIISISIILDEFLLQPLLKKAKSKLEINREIDKRS